MKLLCESSLVVARPVSGSFTINTEQNLDDLLLTSCFYGDIVIEVPVKAAHLENLKMVFGSIYLQSSLLEEFSAKHLEYVTGSLIVGTQSKALPHLKNVMLPKLKEIRGHLQIENTDLISLDLERILGIGSLKIKNNLKLTSVSINNLERAKRFLILEDNPTLSTLALPQLRHVDEFIAISNNPLLKNCSFLKETDGLIFKNEKIQFKQHPKVPPIPNCP
ncbi:MAG: hypothetical protein KBD78_08560 [Oligoflexales bacterium]|nr:hypothetical protein [Oligoflexales bacterium]